MGRGSVGGRQGLYIASSVGRYCIDRKDTVSPSKAKQREERGIMSQKERRREEEILLLVLKKWHHRQYIGKL